MADINLGSLQLTGLSSGIDTNSIIQKLTQLSQQRIAQLKGRENEISNRQTAIKRVESNLGSLQSANAKLAKALNGVFDAKSATSSDDTLATAAAGGSAEAGSTSFRVLSLARNHQIASQGFEGAGSEITQGTITVRSGDASSTITIDNTNNTLQGLARSINNANVGVTATIVSDGSGSATQPYRLVLSAKNGGLANAISITNNLAADASGAIRPELGGKFLNNAVTTSDLGTSTVGTNYGTGGYTGTTNKTYTFTVTSGGTVGTDSVQLSYVDSTGLQSGTITVDPGDVDTLKNVAEGIQVQFSAGTLVAGKSFTVDAFVSTVQAATDASIQIGSGDGAITIASSSNKLENVIPGVTLNLKKADPTKDVEVVVQNDVSTAKSAIVDFVKSYNDFASYIQQQSVIDPTTGISGLLARERSVIDILATVQQSIIGTAPNLPTSINRLSVIGITYGKDGKLAINDAKLDDALAGRLTGITFKDVKRLFSVSGVSSRGEFELVSTTDATKESPTAYDIDITQAARQATITATNTLASSTVIDGTNNTLQIKINGTTSGTLTLTEGTYSQTQLAAELEARINADATLAGRRVTVGVVNQKLVITTSLFGSLAEITNASGTALGALGLTGAETDTGLDVAGNFIVNGLTEAATGVGQLLTGSSGNANTEGLAVKVTVTAAQVLGGVDAQLQVSRGISARFESVLSRLLDATTGRLKNAADSVQRQLENAQGITAKETKSLDDRQATMLRQFAAMETAMSKAKSLSTQLGSLGLSAIKTSS